MMSYFLGGIFAPISPNVQNLPSKGPFKNYIDKILAFFDHLPPSIDIFYLMDVVKKSTILDYLPPPLVNIVGF